MQTEDITCCCSESVFLFILGFGGVYVNSHLAHWKEEVRWRFNFRSSVAVLHHLRIKIFNSYFCMRQDCRIRGFMDSRTQRLVVGCISFEYIYQHSLVGARDFTEWVCISVGIDVFEGSHDLLGKILLLLDTTSGHNSPTEDCIFEPFSFYWY